MKKSYFLFAIIVVILLGITITWYKQKSNDSAQIQSQTPSTSQRRGEPYPGHPPSKDILRREDRYIGDMTISSLTNYAKKELGKKQRVPRLWVGALYNLGFYGTDDAIQILTDYLKENEALLPDPPSRKEELGNETQIKERMTLAYSGTVEGKVLRAAESLIASGSPVGKTTVDEFAVRIKEKYANTDYGTILQEYLEKAIQRGEATTESYEVNRKWYDL